MLFENVHACMCKEKNENGGDGDEKFVGRQNGERKKGRRSQANASERC